MNRITSMEEIEKRAAEWILKFDREGASEENSAALETWLSKDARHREAYLALDEFWDLTTEIKQWHPRDGRIDPDLLIPLSTLPERASRPRMLLIAASLLSVGTVLGWLGLSMSRGETYSTPVGGYERIALDDGSVVQLNTNTVVQTQYTESRRTVKLMHGEAYFDVAQDRERPFEVRVGQAVVRAIGTAFSVRLGEDEQLKLTVTQGRVLLLTDGKERGQPLVAAGQSVQAKGKRVEIVQLEHREIIRQLAWQRGQLTFDRQPLSKVAAEFNRYNRRQVRIEDEKLEALQLTGNFKATDLDSFIAAVKSATNVTVDRTDEVLVIRMR